MWIVGVDTTIFKIAGIATVTQGKREGERGRERGTEREGEKGGKKGRNKERETAETAGEIVKS